MRLEREAMEKDVNIGIMMRASGLFQKGINRTWIYRTGSTGCSRGCLPLCPQTPAQVPNQQFLLHWWRSFTHSARAVTSFCELLVTVPVTLSQKLQINIHDLKKSLISPGSLNSVFTSLGWKPYGINCKCFAIISKHIYLTNLLWWWDAHLKSGYIYKNISLKNFEKEFYVYN